MKYLYLLPLGAALLTASCKNQTASTNPYQSNPYYGPNGSTYGSGSSDYSSTPSSTTSSYPSYSQNTYTPPTQSTTPSPTLLPSVPAAPAYNSNPTSYSSSTASTYTTPYSSGTTGKSHTVAGGETLYRISVKNSTSVAAIKSANGLTSDTIHPGQVLVIP